MTLRQIEDQIDRSENLLRFGNPTPLGIVNINTMINIVRASNGLPEPEPEVEVNWQRDGF